MRKCNQDRPDFETLTHFRKRKQRNGRTVRPLIAPIPLPTYIRKCLSEMDKLLSKPTRPRLEKRAESRQDPVVESVALNDENDTNRLMYHNFGQTAPPPGFEARNYEIDRQMPEQMPRPQQDVVYQSVPTFAYTEVNPYFYNIQGAQSSSFIATDAPEEQHIKDNNLKETQPQEETPAEDIVEEEVVTIGMEDNVRIMHHNIERMVQPTSVVQSYEMYQPRSEEIPQPAQYTDANVRYSYPPPPIAIQPPRNFRNRHYCNYRNQETSQLRNLNPVQHQQFVAVNRYPNSIQNRNNPSRNIPTNIQQQIQMHQAYYQYQYGQHQVNRGAQYHHQQFLHRVQMRPHHQPHHQFCPQNNTQVNYPGSDMRMTSQQSFHQLDMHQSYYYQYCGPNNGHSNAMHTQYQQPSEVQQQTSYQHGGQNNTKR